MTLTVLCKRIVYRVIYAVCKRAIFLFLLWAMSRYSIATEHEHSCCILIAREDKFKINDQWYTWIDYDRYNELILRYYETEGAASFTSEEYAARTPEWALYKSASRGFDPEEQRWHRARKAAIAAETAV